MPTVSTNSSVSYLPYTAGGGGPVDLSDYAYLPGRASGQILRGGTGVGDSMVLQGTTATATASADSIKLTTGNNGDIDAVKVSGDGRVSINGDYDALVGSPIALWGGTTLNSTDGELGLVSFTTDQPAAIFRSTKSPYIVDIAINATQTTDITTGALLRVSKESDLNGFDNTAAILELYDTPSGTGDRDSNMLLGIVDSTTRILFNPRIHDGAGNNAYIFDTKDALTGSTTGLLDIRNQSNSKFRVRANGEIFMIVPTEYADDTAAASGGLAVGDVYRTGSILKVRVA